MSCECNDLGEFVVGEKPAPLVYQFLDASGAPINLTAGYTAAFYVKEAWGAEQHLAAVITDAANGKVTRTWDGTEFVGPGSYNAEFWVGNGTNRFASERICWTARAAVAGVPAL